MHLRFCFLASAALILASSASRAEGVPKKYRPAVKKGLRWLAERQHKDGYWSATRGQYKVAMTSLAGLALLAEGSTTGKGPYAANLRRAADWVLRQSENGGVNDGRIVERDDVASIARYMFDHGYAVLFLSCVYQQEKDKDRRRKLKDVLKRAVRFSRKAQTTRGGWGYVTAKDGNHFDEGASTVVQVHALRAAKHAGITLPARTWEKAWKYQGKVTNAKGGVVYSLAAGSGGGRPPITAAAIDAAFAPNEYDHPLAKAWLRFCQARIPPLSGTRIGQDEFAHFYFARVIYGLGDDGYAKLFPDSKRSERLTWTKYRAETFDHLLKTQEKEGNWPGRSLGPVYPTAVYLTVLQLDNAAIPFFRR